MRRTPLILSSLALASALVLAGCGSTSGSSSATASASASAAATATATVATDVDCSTLTIDTDSSALPTVSGDAGTEPTLSWSGADAPTNIVSKTLSKGDGAEVSSSDIVKVQYAGWKWGESSTFDSSYSTGSAATFSLAQVISGWTCGLEGHHVGDRVELSIPAEYAYGNDSSSGYPTGTLVFVVEIVDAAGTTDLASGTKEAVVDESVVAELEKAGVTVSGDLGSPATVTVASDATEPTETKVYVLAKGTGDAVAADSTLLTHMEYSSWDGTVSQSSWTLEQPQVISMSTATALGDLVGVPVGSRVVVLVPASSSSGSPALAYVLDIDGTL